MNNKLFLIAFCLLGYFSLAQEAEDIVGVWEPGHGKAKVKIDKIDDKFYGKIVWLKEPTDPDTGEAKLDKNNPDESMQNVPLRGYRILKDFEYQGEGVWEEGTIYDPESGTTYSCVITMKDENTLDIRGYVGVKTFGRTDTWRRLTKKK
ncbi:DUF2147 domain-containing protein [Psychroflexus montanilacus]|uniref:DUF2147 domain-containing protein n=1 Tax=Psychroflexus montanilacus TaxID=2873598 RepID=UPI001CCD7A20|nr:DUF2147 domain-containing protein [Psychroflexus montanilacus]MBZ9650630.1 DUF2147 domain-containing protein [Psychroflexus montanilacus]